MNSPTSTTAVDLAPVAASSAIAPATWDTVRHYADAAAKFARCQLACQVMAGFALIELHHAHGVKRGRPKGKSDIEATQASWFEVLTAQTQLALETARRWMEMAKACRPRLRKLDGTDRLKALLELHPSQWTQEDTSLLSEAVHKITDGKTQLEFLFELGIAKKPQGSGATGGAREHPPRPQLTPQLELDQMRELAVSDWQSLQMSLMGYMEKFAFLPDHEINLQIAVLERCASVRQKWLSTPQDKRDPSALREELAEIWFGAGAPNQGDQV